MVHGPDEGPAGEALHRRAPGHFRLAARRSLSAWDRFDESVARQATMDANTNLGSDLHAHGTIPTAKVIRPIETWTTDDVWEHLLKPGWYVAAPTLPRHQPELALLYKDAASGECPVVYDPSQQTCARGRFGCWTCTVVDVDKFG